MKAIRAEVAASISEFTKNAAAVLKEANNRLVAVLKRNRAAFYVVEQHLLEIMLAKLTEQDLYRKAASRIAEKAQAIKVDIDDL